MSLFNNLFGRKKGSKEIQVCEAVLQKTPNDPNILKKLGDLYLKNHDHENASEIYVRLGDLYNEKGFYPKAIALYKQAQKTNPAWEGPYKKLSELYQFQGFTREAAAQYVRLSELMEKNADNEQAIFFMQKAAELDPSHNILNKNIQSFDVHEKAMMETQPGTPAKPAMEKTDFFDLTNELDKEIEDLAIDESMENLEDNTGVDSVFKAIEESRAQEESTDPLFLYNMGLAYRETGLMEEAIESFEKVISTGEKLFDAYIMLGISFRENGLFDQSLKSLNKGAALEDVSGNTKVGILYEMGQTYKAMGDTQQALNIFKEIQKEHKDFKDVEIEIVRLAGGG